jgi:vacuolar-type H+-ATPase subunit H
VSHARDAVEDLVDNAKPVLADARDKAGPVLADARAKAAPAGAAAAAAGASALHGAKAKAAPVLADARDRAKESAKPYLSEAAARAQEQAETARSLAEAKVARLKGEPAPKKGSTLKKIVVLGLVAGAIGFAAKKLGGKDASADSWQSSYTPAPPPAPRSTTSATSTSTSGGPVTGTTSPSAPLAGADLDDDAEKGGASPDEAIADAARGKHEPTTPDSPAEVIDISEGEHKA